MTRGSTSLRVQGVDPTDSRTEQCVRSPPTRGERDGYSGADSPSRPAVHDVGPALKRRPKNFEGAFPLLLVGSALLVYCAILRNEAVASQGAHFPIWGIVGAVGAVIAGAGIYSVFLEPSELGVSAAPEGFVMVPKAEWEASRAGRRASARPMSASPMPPWWEGPPVYPHTSPVRPSGPPASQQVTRLKPVQPTRAVPRPHLTSPSSPRPAGGSMGPGADPRGPTRAVPTPGPAPPTPRRDSLDELKQALTELEALVDSEFKSSPRRLPKAGPGEPGLCADCSRGLPSRPAPVRCSGCDRELCVDCALSSQFEDADLRCIDCRARGPRTGPGATTVAP